MKKETPGINEIAEICSTCGNCLSACPVYNAELTEPNSPRGKVNLIKSLMDGRLESGALNKKFIYQCLVCGSCRHICPNGVEFVDMMVTYRNRISAGRKIPLLKKIILTLYQSILFKKFIGVVDILVKTPLRKIVALPRRRKPKTKKMFTPAKKGGQ
jgi:glycolate oxidase iron-sulfur subunit